MSRKKAGSDPGREWNFYFAKSRVGLSGPAWSPNYEFIPKWDSFYEIKEENDFNHGNRLNYFKIIIRIRL